MGTREGFVSLSVEMVNLSGNCEFLVQKYIDLQEPETFWSIKNVLIRNREKEKEF